MAVAAASKSARDSPNVCRILIRRRLQSLTQNSPAQRTREARRLCWQRSLEGGRPGSLTQRPGRAGKCCGGRTMAGQERALIVGAGAGLSAAIARRCAGEGMAVVLAARDVAKLAALARETGAETVACDATSAEAVERLFAALDQGG